MVEDVGGLLGNTLVGLLASRARDLLGFLQDLVADQLGVVEQLHRVRALGALACARTSVRSSAASTSCVDRAAALRPLEVAVKAGALARVAGGARGLDEGDERVLVAVVAQRLHPHDVARGLALSPQLLARAAEEMDLTASRRVSRSASSFM